jgi:predicted PurR-regulated permease PerM
MAYPPTRRLITRKEEFGRHLWEIPAARDVAVLLFIGFSLWVVYALSEVFTPLIIALLLAYVFNPLVTLLEQRWGWPRPVTVALILTLIVLSLATLVSWLGPLLLEQMSGLARRLPSYLRTLAASYGIDHGTLVSQLEQSIRELQLDPRQVFAQIYKTTGKAVGIVALVFGTAIYLLFCIILVCVAFFFLAWHFNRGLQNLKRYIPESRKQVFLKILSRMDEAIGQFFRGRLFVSLLVGVLLSIGWFLTDVPYWFLLGTVSGLLNVVPYLSVITWPIAILLKYVETLSADGHRSLDFISMIVWPSAVYLLAQLVENWILTPLIQSGQTNLNPATIIVVVFLGAAVAGILGMILAIPIAACIKILCEEILFPRLRRWAAEH